MEWQGDKAVVEGCIFSYTYDVKGYLAAKEHGLSWLYDTGSRRKQAVMNFTVIWMLR